MTARKETAGWRLELRQTIELIEKNPPALGDIFYQVKLAWGMFASENPVSEDHGWAIENRFDTRPSLNSARAELEWVGGIANSTSRRFWGSREMKKILKLLAEKY